MKDDIVLGFMGGCVICVFLLGGIILASDFVTVPRSFVEHYGEELCAESGQTLDNWSYDEGIIVFECVSEDSRDRFDSVEVRR